MSAKDSPSVQTWLSRLGKETARQNIYTFQGWMDWLKNHPKFSTFTPDKLIEYQRAAANGSQYDVLNTLQQYIGSLEGLRYGSKRTRYMVIRGFFLHLRASLPDDPSFRLHSDVPKVVGELKPEEIRAVILSCNKCYRAVFTSIFMGGMDEAGLVYWSDTGLDKLRKDLRGDAETIQVQLPGRKRTRNIESFTTMIGKDAIDSLKMWLKERDESAPREGPIFLDQNGRRITRQAIQKYWLSQARRIGVIPPRQGDIRTRTGKNVHELRDTFRTMWSMSGAAGHVGESMMGHIVDDLGYDKSAKNLKYVEQEYRKAAKFLNLLSGTRAYGVVSEDEVEGLRRQLEESRAKEGGRVAELEQKNVGLEKLVKNIMDRLDRADAANKSGGFSKNP